MRGKAATSTTPYVNGGLTGYDIADNSLRGVDINESTLTKVPDADKLDGMDSAAFLPADGTAANADRLDGMDSRSFLQGAGRFLSNRVEGPTTDVTILLLPGLGTVRGACRSSSSSIYVRNETEATVDFNYMDPGSEWADQDHHALAPGASVYMHFVPNSLGEVSYLGVGQLATGSGAGQRLATITVSAHRSESGCFVQAQATMGGSAGPASLAAP